MFGESGRKDNEMPRSIRRPARFPHRNSLFCWVLRNAELQHGSEIVASERELSGYNGLIMLAWRPLLSMRERVRASGGSSSLHPCETSPSPPRGGGVCVCVDLTFFAACFSMYECSALFRWPWEFTDVENIWHWRSLFPPPSLSCPFGGGGRRPAH